MIKKVIEIKPGEFISRGSIDYLEEYLEGVSTDEIIGCANYDVYNDYVEFCKLNDYENTLNRICFTRRLNKLCGLTTKVFKIDGKCVRVYVPNK